jgi:hypothetical protein
VTEFSSSVIRSHSLPKVIAAVDNCSAVSNPKFGNRQWYTDVPNGFTRSQGIQCGHGISPEADPRPDFAELGCPLEDGDFVTDPTKGNCRVQSADTGSNNGHTHYFAHVTTTPKYSSFFFNNPS